MEVKFINSPNSPHHPENWAILEYEEIDGKLNMWHSNGDDSHYSYQFELNGTEEELEIIKEFCDKIMEAK